MRLLISLALLSLLFSCSVSKNYDPNKKYSKETLQQDYTLLRNILEKKHPSLYWYTPKDSMDYYFDEGFKAIADSMTELQFGWKILAPITAVIHCGHTSFSMSKQWNKFIKNKKIPSFPLHLKIWKDTMVVVYNLNRQDSTIKRGSIIIAINGIKSADMIRIMFDYMVKDGYSDNVNYIRLSTSFPYFHRNIFGLYKIYNVEYLDTSGNKKNASLPYYEPPKDSVNRKKNHTPGIQENKLSKKQKLEFIRSTVIDTSSALMTINSFSKARLHGFFKKSFRTLREKRVKNLIIDIRTNGGGDITNYVLLTKFLRREPFKVADTSFAISNTFRPFTKFVSSGFFDNIALKFITRKQGDGNYHFRYWERHTFRVKRKNHFDGDVYVLINGLTFSASSLFCNAIKGQENVKLIGEETGGGWYGNSGIMIPDITLPNTRLKVRLPFFRLVQYQHVPFKGTGVIPDIYLGPYLEDVIQRRDTKMEQVKKMIGIKDGLK